MMKLKIFWKKNCPQCPGAKRIGKMFCDKIDVQYFDIEEIEGLTEACMWNIMSTPSFVLVDNANNEKTSWRGVVPEPNAIDQEIF